MIRPCRPAHGWVTRRGRRRGQAQGRGGMQRRAPFGPAPGRRGAPAPLCPPAQLSVSCLISWPRPPVGRRGIAGGQPRPSRRRQEGARETRARNARQCGRRAAWCKNKGGIALTRKHTGQHHAPWLRPSRHPPQPFSTCRLQKIICKTNKKRYPTEDHRSAIPLAHGA